MACNQFGHHRSVDDPKTVDAEDAKLGIDDGILVDAHLACADVVQGPACSSAEVTSELLVGLDGGSRREFPYDERTQRILLVKRTHGSAPTNKTVDVSL